MLPPRNRLIIYGVVAVAGLAYLAWVKWGAKPMAPGQVVTAPVAKAVADMPTKTVAVPKLQVIKDGVRATEKLKIPPPLPREEVQTAVAVQPAKYGATATVFVNTSTGQTRTVVKANSAPWFALERGTTFGAEVGIGSHGRYYQTDVQRDVFSIKGVTFAARGEVISYPTETGWTIGVRAEKTFDW